MSFHELCGHEHHFNTSLKIVQQRMETKLLLFSLLLPFLISSSPVQDPDLVAEDVMRYDRMRFCLKENHTSLLCTLKDVKYVVFHAAISSQGYLVVQDYYIRHMNGCILDADGEKERVIKCLVVSIERIVSHGLRLDMCAKSRMGLLSDITWVFHEHGVLLIRRM